MASPYTKIAFTDSAKGITATKLNLLRDDLSTAIAAAGSGGTPASGVFIWGETPVGAINGTNKNFSTAYSYTAGQLAVYLNGVRQRSASDYTVTGATSFQMISAPLSGDSLSVDYMKQ